MDERTSQPSTPERPIRHDAVAARGRRLDATAAEAAGLDDPRALTILTTEHWSLLSARGLVYNEAFARAGMFLTFLSATLVALGLVSAGTGFSGEFLVVAAVVLALDLFVGLATLARIASASSEDMRYLQGMNRLRHAYHEIVPGLEPYFISGKHDDAPGVYSIYGTVAPPSSMAGVVHGLTTTPGMIAVICSAVGAALVAIVVLLAGASTAAAAAAGAVTLGAGIVGSVGLMIDRVRRFTARMQPVFPTPIEDPLAAARDVGDDEVAAPG